MGQLVPHYALATLRILSKPAAKTSCAKEILAPVAAAAARLTATLSGAAKGAAGAKKNKQAPAAELSGALASAAAAAAGLEEDVAAALAGKLRAPLAWRTKKADAIKQFNPMYEEEGYQKGRDYDPNRERAEKKKLQRELKQVGLALLSVRLVTWNILAVISVLTVS
jgi:nucleolar protein 14